MCAQRRGHSVCGCQGMQYLTSRAKSAYVWSMTWPHPSLRASSFACHGEITMAPKLTWWLVQQDAALKQQAQLVSICWLKNKQKPLPHAAEHWTWAERYHHCRETPAHTVHLGCSQFTLKLFNLHSCHQGRFRLPLHLQLHIPTSSSAFSRWWAGSQAWDIQKATMLSCQWGQLGGVSAWLQGVESERMK